MHYTSIENIHKVIDPLFLSDLKAEFEEIKALKTENIRKKRFEEFQKKLSELTFLETIRAEMIRAFQSAFVMEF